MCYQRGSPRARYCTYYSHNGRKTVILNGMKEHIKPHILFFNNSNDLAIWNGFPDIMYIKVNNNHKSSILNFIEVKFFGAYSP